MTTPAPLPPMVVPPSNDVPEQVFRVQLPATMPKNHMGSVRMHVDTIDYKLWQTGQSE